MKSFRAKLGQTQGRHRPQSAMNKRTKAANFLALSGMQGGRKGVESLSSTIDSLQWVDATACVRPLSAICVSPKMVIGGAIQLVRHAPTATHSNEGIIKIALVIITPNEFRLAVAP